MSVVDVIHFVQEHKFWMAACVPVVIAFVVIKILN